MRCLRSETGCELVSAACDSFLGSKGICRASTSPHTPEQDEQSKWAVRMIKDGLRMPLLQV